MEPPLYYNCVSAAALQFCMGIANTSLDFSLLTHACVQRYLRVKLTHNSYVLANVNMPMHAPTRSLSEYGTPVWSKSLIATR